MQGEDTDDTKLDRLLVAHLLVWSSLLWPSGKAFTLDIMRRLYTTPTRPWSTMDELVLYTVLYSAC